LKGSENGNQPDSYSRTASDTISLSLPSTNNFSYDHTGSPGEIMRLGWQPDTNSLLPVIMVPKARTLSHREILTNDGRRVFEYDYENQLTNVYVAAEWRSEFKYDAFGRRRVRKEYGLSGSAWSLTNEVRYVYDGMLTVQERDGNNLAMVSYTRGNDLSGSLQGAGGIGGLLARSEMSNLQSPHAYYHADGNGNVTAMVDTNGILVARYQYGPYGNLLGMSGPLAEANVYRFSSKEWCANAGLYYYGFRYYEPNLQRWLNRDPLGEEGGLNLYGFCANNSFSYVDIDGLALFGLYDTWGEYWGEVGDTLIGELKGAGAELSLGFYEPCYTSALQKQGGYVGAGLAMAGETLAGFGVAGTAAKSVKGASQAVKSTKEFSHWIPDRYIRPRTLSGRNPNPHYKPWLDNRLGRSFVNSRWNGNNVSQLDHWLNDNWRRLDPDEIGDAVRNRFLAQQFNRAPVWLKAAAGSTAAGIGGTAALTDSGSACQ
jgi:RHS repeat-associated protein